MIHTRTKTKTVAGMRALLRRAVACACAAAAVAAFAAPEFAFADTVVRVTTQPASSVTAKSAILNMHVSHERKNSYVWFEWGEDRDFGNATTRKGVYNEAPVGVYVGGLREGVRYYYRAAATADGHPDVLYGDTYTFVAGAPSSATAVGSGEESDRDERADSLSESSSAAITEDPGVITPTSAQVKGLAVPVGDLSTVGWFEWGRTPSLGNATDKEHLGSGPASFERMLWGLPSKTVFYYRAVIESADGVAYGEIKSFTTRASSAIASGSNPVSSESSGSAAAEDETPRQAAALFSSGGFLPETGGEWMIVAVLLFLIIFSLNYIYVAHLERRNKRDEEKNAEKDIPSPDNSFPFPVR